MDVLAIIRRIDTNGDAIISFDEFEDFLKPDYNAIPVTYEPIAPARAISGYAARGTSPMR